MTVHKANPFLLVNLSAELGKHLAVILVSLPSMCIEVTEKAPQGCTRIVFLFGRLVTTPQRHFQKIVSLSYPLPGTKPLGWTQAPYQIR